MGAVLVTGAAGFLGSRLVERRLAAGEEVTGVDCFTSFYAESRKRKNLEGALAHPRFRLLTLDLSCDDLASLPPVDVVYHLAAQAGVRDSWGPDFGEYVRHNLLGTQRLLERLGDRPPRRLVYASSSSVYGNAERLPTSEDERPRPFSPYGVTKLAAEHLSLVYHANRGLPVVCLRLFTVYGPRQRPDMGFHRFFEALREGRPLAIHGDGAQSRDFTFVEDCLDAVEAAAERGRPGAVYNVGSGRAISVRDVIETMERVTGIVPRLEHGPAVAGDVRQTSADPARARADLGTFPRVSLEDGLAAQWEWQRAAANAHEAPV